MNPNGLRKIGLKIGCGGSQPPIPNTSPLHAGSPIILTGSRTPRLRPASHLPVHHEVHCGVKCRVCGQLLQRNRSQDWGPWKEGRKGGSRSDAAQRTIMGTWNLGWQTAIKPWVSYLL